MSKEVTAEQFFAGSVPGYQRALNNVAMLRQSLGVLIDQIDNAPLGTLRRDSQCVVTARAVLTATEPTP